MAVPTRRLEQTAALASLAAGGLHGLVVPPHLEEWWGYGLFFIAIALAQALFGLALLTDAVNPRDTGPEWRTWRARVLRTGFVAMLLVLALYATTRTVGIPFVGPEAWVVHDVGPIDAVATALEVLLVAMLVALMRRDRRAHGIEP